MTLLYGNESGVPFTVENIDDSIEEMCNHCRNVFNLDGKIEFADANKKLITCTSIIEYLEWYLVYWRNGILNGTLNGIQLY